MQLWDIRYNVFSGTTSCYSIKLRYGAFLGVNLSDVNRITFLRKFHPWTKNLVHDFQSLRSQLPKSLTICHDAMFGFSVDPCGLP